MKAETDLDLVYNIRQDLYENKKYLPKTSI